MGRKKILEDTVSYELTIDGIVYGLLIDVEGWYFPGDSWGYGTEPPDGDDRIVDVRYDYAYIEETEEPVDVSTITDEIKSKIREQLEYDDSWK